MAGWGGTGGSARLLAPPDGHQSRARPPGRGSRITNIGLLSPGPFAALRRVGAERSRSRKWVRMKVLQARYDTEPRSWVAAHITARVPDAEGSALRHTPRPSAHG